MVALFAIGLILVGLVWPLTSASQETGDDATPGTGAAQEVASGLDNSQPTATAVEPTATSIEATDTADSGPDDPGSTGTATEAPTAQPTSANTEAPAGVATGEAPPPDPTASPTGPATEVPQESSTAAMPPGGQARQAFTMAVDEITLTANGVTGLLTTSLGEPVLLDASGIPPGTTATLHIYASGETTCTGTPVETVPLMEVSPGVFQHTVASVRVVHIPYQVAAAGQLSNCVVAFWGAAGVPLLTGNGSLGPLTVPVGSTVSLVASFLPFSTNVRIIQHGDS
jgi:hypothetical protein